MRRQADPFIIPNQSGVRQDNALPHFSYNSYQGDSYFETKLSAMWLGKAISLYKIYFILAVIFFLFLILFSRLIYLQIMQGDNYYGIAEGNRLRTEFLPTDRGIFFDRWHTPLVENVAAFSVYFLPYKFSGLAADTEKLAEIFAELGINAQAPPFLSVADLLSSQSPEPVLVKEHLSYEEALASMIVSRQFGSLEVVIDPYRHYLGGDYNAHLLGYTSRISDQDKDKYLQKGYQLFERIGRAGLEQYYEEELRGQPGSRRIEVDNLGQEHKIIDEQNSQPGKNLILSIDNGLQEFIYQTIKKYQPWQAVAVVALDPNSGKVRALVSSPSFDNNAFSQSLSVENYQSVIDDPLKPLFNRAIAGEYPSGSTIKLIVGAAALAEGLVNRSTTVYSSGGVWYDKWFFPDWKAGGHGLTDINKAIAESVNTFFYYLALAEFNGHYGLGLDKILKYFSLAGLSSRLGIDLTGESPGFLPSVAWKEKTKGEVWYPGDTLHLVIGQGDLLVTPLQVADYTAMVANRGTLYQPELVEEIIDPLTNQVQAVEPKIIRRRVFPRESLDIIAEGMRSTVVWGSARSLGANPLGIAGKTGTAEVGGNQEPHAWFTSFAPYQNPDLVLTVLIEHGTTSDNAVLLAREIWQWYNENRK
ncbi:MAG: Penicillin-binding protein 2 [Parcubacteria group bacterium GW2011_GWA2_43_17]|nr:MAG: Penicillin-binding protein 2 [Parcubacteria group bacterium GW2011_GWA2_43_17]KKT92343.1 MAG: Penicillin-binding protein 2 [Parcubacteria group bacterium GW2011_GWF2_45_11]KKT97328.1 MAG: Penicillin-binding protein 2 [Parcubacteria group bacterium GW2011_GWC2_45_15]OGY92993.1 MAG: penicillin-binding protein 2 [Candidatus Komeilibacteria bacterium RIFOXYA2_FULL_45_9]OGY96248.1 MAG: penicillin-binding protein 2 [Candidatus Komeilibacteria bacterium RIFOXYC2_FULL_45_12]HAH04630.1 penicill